MASRAVTYYRNVLWSVPAPDPAYRANQAKVAAFRQRGRSLPALVESDLSNY